MIASPLQLQFERTSHAGDAELQLPYHQQQLQSTVPRRRRGCFDSTVAACTLFAVLLTILHFTVFQPKNPSIHLLSASLGGVSPNRILDAKFSVRNPNAFAFGHGNGSIQLYYPRGDLILGGAVIPQGNVGAGKSKTVEAAITISLEEAEKENENGTWSLVGELYSRGMVSFELRSEIPGRGMVYGFLKRRVAAVAVCPIDITTRQDSVVVMHQCQQQAYNTD